jgi:hypothetical protein
MIKFIVFNIRLEIFKLLAAGVIKVIYIRRNDKKNNIKRNVLFGDLKYDSLSENIKYNSSKRLLII